MKAVIDTNVLFSACWKPDGLEARTVNLAIGRAFTMCISPAIVTEYRDVFARKKLLPLRKSAEDMLRALERVWISYDPVLRVSDCIDDDDNRFLECAHTARADYLITGNLRHYPGIHGLTRIVNARQFLEAFSASMRK